jgi:hypothetical protein
MSMTLRTQGTGTIKALKGIGHQTYKGVADWFFVADVTYDDGGENRDLQVAPYALSYESEADKPELDAAMRKLNEYLDRNGEWHDDKRKRDGRIYCWTPKSPKGMEPL